MRNGANFVGLIVAIFFGKILVRKKSDDAQVKTVKRVQRVKRMKRVQKQIKRILESVNPFSVVFLVIAYVVLHFLN